MQTDSLSAKTKLSVGILETGVLPVSLAERFGRYDDMVRRMLGYDHDYRTYRVHAGELPIRLEHHAAYVITGSSAGVYDPLPWIEILQDFIQTAHGRTKLIGLCFGHQAMAQALGGRVEKSSKGWGLGLHRYDVVAAAPWMDRRVTHIAVPASHQDQVVAIPEGATVLAQSTFTPFASLFYACGRSISVQFHPEFENAFAAELVELRRPLMPDQAAADHALASLEAQSDAPLVGSWLKRFIANP